jgi:ABC-type spermidine/putrescine transport system permease subunit I
VRLNRQQADIVAPGIWLVVVTALACFARPALVGGTLIGTLVLGVYYAARDAAGHE